jgi:hypothetical protein
MKANMQISRLVTAGLKVKTAVKGGKLAANHCGSALAVEASARRRG